MASQKLKFVTPLPWNPVPLGTTLVTVELDPPVPLSEDVRVGWMTADRDVAAMVFATRTIPAGQTRATNRLVVKQRVGTPLNPLPVMVSVWDADTQDPDHYTSLYPCVIPDVMLNQNRQYVLPNVEPALNDPEYTFQLKARVTDDIGRPVKGYALQWYGDPTVPRFMDSVGSNADTWHWDPDNNWYASFTDENGEVNIRAGNTARTIIKLWCQYTASESMPPLDLVYTTLGSSQAIGIYNPPTPYDMNINNDVGDNVYVQLPYLSVDFQSSWIAMWANGSITPPIYIGQDYQNKKIPIPKAYFKVQGLNLPTENKLGFVVSTATNGNGNDSRVGTYMMIGTTQSLHPTNPAGDNGFPAPQLASHGSIVNYQEIVGGLTLWIPAYDGMTVSDQGAVNIYLNAYFPGSRIPRAATFAIPFPTLGMGELTSGFTVTFRESDVAGFASSIDPGDPPGKFEAQYSVSGQGGTHVSAVLSLPLSDVP